MTLEDEADMYREIAEKIDDYLDACVQSVLSRDPQRIMLRRYDLRLYLRNLNRRLQPNRKPIIHLCK